jgi:hypothetical protein
LLFDPAIFVLYRPVFWHILGNLSIAGVIVPFIQIGMTRRGKAAYATMLLLVAVSATVLAFPRPTAPTASLSAAQLSAGTEAAEPWPDPDVIAERKRSAEGRPLFRASEPLAFTLRADFQTVQKDRAPESTTTYAVASPRLGLSSVRERLYRGPCRTVDEFEPFFARFRAIRPAINGVYDSVPNLNARYIRQAQDYLEQFYRIIDQPASIKRAFIDKCGDMAGM